MSIALSSPWRRMLAVNVVVAAALFAYKFVFNYPGLQYTQLLSDYHFGLTKRSLIGALVGVVFPVLPSWSPYVVGTLIWLVTLALFLLLFRRTFGFGEDRLPLLVFTAGSPFFLKNFVQTLGYYDIYGCALAIALLLIPARTMLYVLAAAAGSMILILIHHVHMLLYIPTIGAIVILRHHLMQRVTIGGVVLSALLAGAVGALFVIMQFYGSPTVPFEAFSQHLHDRASDPADVNISAGIFYRTFGDEIRDTWALMPKNLLRVPIYLALIALHAPLIRYFRDLVRALAERRHRVAVILAALGISIGYLVIFATVFDYARWISDWATCMLLLMFAVRQLPAALDVALIPAAAPQPRALGWILTVIPRVGLTKPF
ncbi:MAG: hypothetical protein AB1586_11770 [Pseudomonadota bacterium]